MDLLKIRYREIEFLCPRYSSEEIFEELLKTEGFTYLCACDARSFWLSKKLPSLGSAYYNASVILSDGRPLFEIISWNMSRRIHLTGPDIMFSALSNMDLARHKHFFIGGPAELLNAVTKKSRVHGVNVVGSICPPFTDIDSYDWDSILNTLQSEEPDFIWVGLGAPKQEEFMLRLSQSLKKGTAFGVGLAFNQYIGDVRRAPSFISTLSLEWLFRYIQQPLRIKRFIIPALAIMTPFIYSFVKRIAKKISSQII